MIDQYEFKSTLPFKYGSKLDNDLSTTVISKLIRKDIKTAIKSEFLPDAKYSVRTQNYAGGSSININIKEMPYPVHDLDFLIWTNDHPHEMNPRWASRWTEAAQRVLWTVEAIGNQFNFDKSDSQIDYFFVNFYLHVGWQWEWESRIRGELEKALAA